MEQTKVQQLLMQYKELIPGDKLNYLKGALEKASDDAYNSVLMAKTYNKTTTLLLSIFLGGLGVDRFYIGDTGIGVAKLLLGWLTFGIWPLVDIFCTYKKAQEKTFNNIISAL